MATDWIARFKEAAGRSYDQDEVVSFQCLDADIDIRDLLPPVAPQLHIVFPDPVRDATIMAFLEEYESQLAMEIVCALIQRVK